MKKILLLTVLLVASQLVFQGCSKDELDTTGSVAGVITDAETNRPLLGVTVTLSPSGRSFTTGDDGRYQFLDMALGKYVVQAVKAGYASEQRSVEILAGETSSLDIPLRSSAPKLELSSQTLDFGNDATTLTLDIRNTGLAELTWQVSEDIPWLSCQPVSGTTSAGKSSSVIVTVDRSSLGRGSYTQTIAVASNGGSQNVRVTMTVADALPIEVTPEVLDFGTTTTSLQVKMTNPDTGRTMVAYTITASNNWIHPEKTKGQFTYTETINVTVDRSSLAEGNYKGSLTISVDGQEKEIPVTMSIAAKAKPQVNMTAIENVSSSGASLRAALVSTGSSRVTHHGFVWATESGPTVAANGKCDLGDAREAYDFSYQLSNLQAGTTYYVRAYAENDEGISYSTEHKFTTERAATAPVVETGEVTNVKSQQAEAAGNLIDPGVTSGVTAHGHVWSTQPAPTINDQKSDLGAKTTKGTFKSTLTALEPHTKYYVRAYARNQYGISYGEDVQFTTAYGDVTLTTTTPTNITQHSATAGGSITAFGGNTIEERGICWGRQADPTRTQNHVKAEGSDDSFTAQLTELEENTTYHVRAYVITSTGATFYGQDVTFQTLYEVKMPTLSAVTATDVTYRTAKLTATVTSDGHGTLADAGFVYATTNAPTLADTKVSCGAKTALTASLSNLQPETKYYVRAYATNEKGTAYGEETVFTTKTDPGQTDIDKDGFGDEKDWSK